MISLCCIIIYQEKLGDWRERGGQSGLLRGDTDFTLEVNLLLEVKIKVFFLLLFALGILLQELLSTFFSWISFPWKN